MVNSQETVVQLSRLFSKVCKIIYVDLDYTKTINDEDGNKIEVQNIPFIIYMLFYFILSQYFKKIKIKFAGELTDLRLSIFCIRPSRMGKGQLIKIVEEAAKNLMLNTKRVSYLNQASLIGTINQFAVEYNLKKNLKPEMQGYLDPVIKGDLANYDILIIPEAKKLVKGVYESETEFILSTFQEALDYPGYINKKLKYETEISYQSTVSIFSATYYVEEIATLLLEQGFFQRNLIDKKNFTLEEVEKIRTLIIEKYRNSGSNDIIFSEQMKKFTDIIISLKNEERTIEFSDIAVDLLQKFNKEYFNRIKKITGKELEILKSFSQTIIHMVTKIAGINCCLREDTKINITDLTLAIELFHHYTKILTTQLNVKEKKKDNDSDNYKNLVIDLYKKYITDNQRNPHKNELVKECKKIGLGFNKSVKLINMMIEENYFVLEKISGEGNYPMLKLVED